MTGDPRLPKIYLKPGELSVNQNPAEVSTVLGSCVAVVLYSPRQAAGAICHAMLPYGGADAGFKYVDGALRYMLECFARAGIRPAETVVKLFGGADMFDTRNPVTQITVGRQNIDAARAILKRQSLTISKQDVGGSQGRKLLFYPHTGEVFLKHLGRQRMLLPQPARRR